MARRPECGAGHRGLLAGRCLGRGGRAAGARDSDPALHARNGGAARKRLPHARDAGPRPAGRRRGSRFRALHDSTAALPALGPCDETLPVGRSTREAMQQGFQQGLCYEIEGHVGRMRGEFDDLLVIFTGGDAEYFVKRIKNTIFADCDLVLMGLNRILEYHVHAEK